MSVRKLWNGDGGIWRVIVDRDGKTRIVGHDRTRCGFRWTPSALSGWPYTEILGAFVERMDLTRLDTLAEVARAICRYRHCHDSEPYHRRDGDWYHENGQKCPGSLVREILRLEKDHGPRLGLVERFEAGWGRVEEWARQQRESAQRAGGDGEVYLQMLEILARNHPVQVQGPPPEDEEMPPQSGQ